MIKPSGSNVPQEEKRLSGLVPLTGFHRFIEIGRIILISILSVLF